MPDTKTFKDIDKRLQKLVDETKANFKISDRWQKKLDDHAIDLIGKLEEDRKPRAKIQKEMLRVLETQEAQDKVRSRDKISADFKLGKATIEQLKAARLTKEDLVRSGFGGIGSNIELMKQFMQEGFGSFTSAIKGWWENIKENSIVLRTAKQFWESTAVKKFKEFGSHVAGVIGTHMREVLGEFAEVFDIFKKLFGAIKDSIVNTFAGAFAAVKEKRTRDREKKMVKHLSKIETGIGFLVRGEKVAAITGDGKKKKGLLGFLADIFGSFGLTGTAIVAGVAALALWVFNIIKKTIKGYFEEGLAGGVKGFLTAVTDIPRSIIAWVAGLFGADKLAAALSDESFNQFMDDIQQGITDFMKSISDWFSETWSSITSSLSDLWKDMVPKWLRDLMFPKADDTEFLKKKTDNIVNKINETAGSKTEDRVRTEHHRARKALDDYREALLQQEELTGVNNTKELKKVAEQIERLNGNLQTNLQNAQPIVNPWGGPMVGGGEREIDKTPSTDQGLMRDNNNFFGDFGGS